MAINPFNGIEPEPDGDGGELVLLGNYFSELDAFLLKNRLTEQGIECYFFNENSVAVRTPWDNSGIRIMVKERDLALARQITEKNKLHGSNFKECSVCGSSEWQVLEKHNWLARFLLRFIKKPDQNLPGISHIRVCKNCGAHQASD